MKIYNDIWPLIRLEDLVVDIQPGFAQRPNVENIGIPQLRTNNISPQGNLDLSELTNVKITPGELEKYGIQKGDVIFNNTNSVEWVGKTAYYNIDRQFVLSNHMTRIRTNDTLIDPEFLAKYLHYLWRIGMSRSRAKQWVNQAAIDQAILAKFEVPLPSLEEQRRIVAVLRQADELWRLRRKANEKVQNLVVGLFYEMYGAPHSWQRVLTLSEFVDFVGGGTPSRKVERYFTGNIPWATSKDIKARYLDDAEEHITQEAIQESATNLVPAGTILLVVKSKILTHSLPMSILKRPFCFGQDLKGLVPKPGVESLFIVAALLAQSNNILRSARGVNTEGLTLDILREIPIPQTNAIQQSTFVEQVNTYNQIENAHLASQLLIDTLFQSLLTQVFTGELTATWREKQTEHLAEVEQKLLKQFHQFVQEYSEKHDLDLKPKPVVLVQRPGTRSALSEEQVILLYELSSMQGYFTVETIKAKSELSLNTIRQGLQLFAEIGLIKAVRLPDRPMQDVVVYVLSYRGLRQEDQARELDLDILLKGAAS